MEKCKKEEGISDLRRKEDARESVASEMGGVGFLAG